MKLNDLKLGDVGVIVNNLSSKEIKKRLMDLGFNKGSLVKVVLIGGSMRAYLIKGTVIAVRLEDTELVEVSL